MSVVHDAPPHRTDTPQPHSDAAQRSGGNVTPLANRKRRGPNVPRVGDRITESGAPSLAAWASCLSLGDLEAAVRRSVAA